MLDSKNIAGLSKEQKTGFVLLLIFAILAISLGVLQIRNTMYKPFALSNKVPPLADSTINDTNALRYRDTDKDGLNDFEELYVYSTSPYLEDTDSDGVKDGQEVKAGTNPLCATGKNCFGSTVTSRSGEYTQSASSSVANWVKPPSGKLPIDLNKALQDTKQVRKMLIDAGVEKDLLDKISDQQLQALVNQTMKPTSTINLKAQDLYNNFSTSTH